MENGENLDYLGQLVKLDQKVNWDQQDHLEKQEEMD